MPLTSGRTDGVAAASRWRGFGLTIQSPIAIPGALPCTDIARPLDLVVSVDQSTPPPNLTDQPPYRVGKSWLELSVPNLCKFTLIGNEQLILTPAAGASNDALAAMLVASGLPMALWAKGGLLLHASAIASISNETAIAIAGPSGAGKSRLLEQLVSEGLRGVADDSVWLRQTPRGFSAAGLPGGCFVRTPAQPGRQFKRFDPAQCLPGAPLGALVFLTPADSTSRLLPLHGQAAIAAVLRHRHRPTAACLLGREKETFELAALLCRQVPMYALHFNPADPEPAVATLQSLLSAPDAMTAKV